MAGHNKWSKIKHRKAAVEKKKTRLWSKVSRAIMVAARNGGPDPESNLSLRYAIDEARYANMPRDTIERAIKKGSGELGDGHWENVRYEGYGPSGAAIIIEALTNNRTRTVGDIRLAFSKYGGSLGNAGCVGYMFDTKGQILIGRELQVEESQYASGRKGQKPKASDEHVMESAINAGADDVQSPDDEDDPWTVLTAPTQFQAVKEGLEKAGLTITEATIALIPQNRVEARGDDAKSLLDLIDALEELDDVQKVYANFDIPDDELAAMG
jgi:YebC/PmpR family DNA-binding regulatory protein